MTTLSAVPKVAVFATLTAQPGRRDDLIEVITSMFDAVGGEEGTEIYALHTVESDPDKVMFYELYSDADALKAHSRSEAMKAAGPKFAGVLAGAPEIVVTSPVQAKGLTF